MKLYYHVKAGEKIDIIQKLLDDEFFKPLKDAAVRIGVLDIEATGDAEVPLTVNGGQAWARIRLTNQKERAMVPYDCIIEVDKAKFEELDELERQALMEHELTHLVIVLDKEGGIALTEDLRPRMKIRPDDWTLTGFHRIVRKYKESALEFQSVGHLAECLSNETEAKASS